LNCGRAGWLAGAEAHVTCLLPETGRWNDDFTRWWLSLTTYSSSPAMSSSAFGSPSSPARPTAWACALATRAEVSLRGPSSCSCSSNALEQHSTPAARVGQRMARAGSLAPGGHWVCWRRQGGRQATWRGTALAFAPADGGSSGWLWHCSRHSILLNWLPMLVSFCQPRFPSLCVVLACAQCWAYCALSRHTHV
jgi:hypothetical protein